jgi:hypothetical protein
VKLKHNPAKGYLPFPTAWPNAGVTIKHIPAGQHASNPENLLQHIAQAKRNHPPRQRREIFTWNPTLFHPTFPATPGQMTKLIQTWLTRYWAETLTSAGRAQWAAFATANTLTNMFGTTKNLSGFGAFLNINRLMWAGGTQEQYPPPATLDPPFPLPPSPWVTLATIQVDSISIARVFYKSYNFLEPEWLITATPNWPTTTLTWGLTFWLTYPARVALAHRQAERFPACKLAPHYPTPPSLSAFSNIKVLSTKPGTLITLAYVLIGSDPPGASPMTFITLPLTGS